MPTRKDLTPDLLAAMVREYASGLSVVDLGVLHSLSVPLIYRRLRDAGVEFNRAARAAAKLRGRKRPPRDAQWATKIALARRGRPNGHLGAKRSEAARGRMRAAQRRIQDRDPERLTRARAARRPPMSERDRLAINRVRCACKNMLHRILRMARRRKDCKLEVALGYTQKQLRAHLEARFTPGMSWEAPNSFHIDHVVPVAYFLKLGITDPAIINALENLQPLPPAENRLKGARLTASGGPGHWEYTLA